MIEKEILNKRELLVSYIDNYKFFSAFSLVRDLLTAASLRNLNHVLDREEQTYRYMIQYFVEGLPDENRDNLLSEIKDNLLMLADMSFRAIKAKDSSEYYYTLLRMSDYKNEKLSELIKEYGETVSELSLLSAGDDDISAIRLRKESILERLFNSLLTSLKDEEAYRDLTKYVLSGYADNDISLLSISAITLSLMVFYDKAKLNLLLDVYESTDNPAIEARALIGIIFALNVHSARIALDSKLRARLSLWNDSLENYAKIRNALRMIVSTRDTEIVSSKFKDEVLPKLMKLRPEIMDKLKNIEADELEGEGMINNPEWEELLDKSGLSKKMQELSELQSEGADLMMITFSNLKQFPFFNSASNWFLPFDIDNSSLNVPEELKEMVGLLHESSNMICDSDLYSLALAAPHMPPAQRQMIKSQLGMQMDHIREEMKETELHSSIPNFDNELLKAIRDLYRFFRLFKKKQGFINPFSKPLEFYNFPGIGSMLRDDDILELIAEYYFKRGFYSDALPILQLIVENQGDNAATWEKIGFCFQHQGNFSEALISYNNAALLGAPGLWLTKKLAFVNRVLGNTDEAINYYLQVLDKEPENLNVMLNIGHLFVEKHQYEDALRHYYHALYLSPENEKVIRSISWAELISGNFEKSEQYYSKLLSGAPKCSDYLNLGHASFLRNHIKDALNYYRIANEMDAKSFAASFAEDAPMLLESGLSRTEVSLMLDLVLSK